MQRNYLQPVIQSTQKIFQQLLNLSVHPVQPSEEEKKIESYKVSGIIHFTNGVKGSLIVSFPEQTALQLVGKLLAEESHEEIDPAIIIDGIGEITNLICGNSKAGMKQFGWKLELSLPHVVIGDDYCIRRPRDVLSLVSLFESELGNFLIELSLKLDEPVLNEKI